MPDTLAQQIINYGNSVQSAKNDIAAALFAKGQAASGNDALSSYAPKIASLLHSPVLFNEPDKWTSVMIPDGAYHNYTIKTAQLYNEKIYCLGSSSNVLKIFDIATLTWKNGANTPASATKNTSVFHEGKIYSLGSNSRSLHIYDIETDTWVSGASAPTAVQRYGSCLHNGKIYYPANLSNELQIYDIATNTWTNGANIPYVDTNQRYNAALFEGKIYCLLNGSYYIQIYDIESNKWSLGAPSPDNNYNRYSCCVHNGKIYYPAEGLPAILAYDPALDMWEESYTENVLYTSCLAGMGDSVYVCCKTFEYDTGGYFSSLERISFSEGAMTITPCSPLRYFSEDRVLVAHNQRLYCPKVIDNQLSMHIYQQ